MNKLLSSITLSFIVTGGLIAGEITGVVKYIGKPPKAKRLRMDADPVCAASLIMVSKDLRSEISEYSSKERCKASASWILSLLRCSTELSPIGTKDEPNFWKAFFTFFLINTFLLIGLPA